MLYFHNARHIEGTTVYPDTDLGHVFYAIPAYPRLRLTGPGEPVFQLIKFRGGTDNSALQLAAASGDSQPDALPANAIPTVDGEVAGGFLIFDTEYSLSQEQSEAIRAQLSQEVGELPEGFEIELRAPTWTDGEVRLLMEDTANGLYRAVSKGGKPSLMGNNVASFAAVLESWQTSLMEQAITTGQFAPIQVHYNLKYLAKLPPVRIRIYALAYDMYKMYKEYGEEVNGGGACSDPDTVVRRISERVHSRNVVRITIDSGGLTIDDENFKALQQMALGIFQDWIKTELVKPPPPRATKEQIENLQLAKLTQEDFSDLDIRIEQRATVELSIHPQGTLGALSPDLDLERHVVEIDLDEDEFYQNREVGIKVYADFPEAGAAPQPTEVLFVEVTAYYGDGPGQSMTWDATGGGGNERNGGRWPVKWHKVPDVTEVRWEARIRFRDPDHEMKLEGVSNRTDINIAVGAPGRALLRLDHLGMPWDIVQYVEATVRFAQGDADPREVERTFLFAEESAGEKLFDEAIWVDRQEPFHVSLKYRLKNGNVIQQGEHRNVLVNSDRFVIKSPFEHYLDIPIEARWTHPEWQEDIVELEYRDDANDYVARGEIVLSVEGGLRQRWSVPLLEPERKNFRYHWTRRSANGGTFTSADVDGAPADGWTTGAGTTVVAAGDPNSNEDMLRVVVDPLVSVIGIPDEPEKKVIRIVAHMAYDHDGRRDVDDHVFRVGEDAWTWTQHIEDLDKRRYQWWAEYYTQPYSKITMGTADNPNISETETVVLEPPSAQ